MSPFSSHRLQLLPPFLLLFAVLVGAPMAQAATTGSGRVASEARAVSNFDGIAVSGSMTLEVRQTGKESVTLTADDNLLPLIETVVDASASGRTLQVRFKRGERVFTRSPVKVTVEVTRLTHLSSSGSGDIAVDELKTPQLKLSVSGSGDARLRALATDAFEVRIAGSGDVHATGTAQALKLSIAGSGDVTMFDLVCDEVSVSIAGSGNAQVTANKSLSATIAGSGDVQYRGNAASVRTSVAGSGSISKR